MIKGELKNNLLKVLGDDKLNIKGLIEFMENSDIDYYMADLRGPLGMATFNGVYLDIKQINQVASLSGKRIFYFIILHETAHIKRMRKMGKEKVLCNLSLPEFNDFFEHVVNEEIIADKYGSIMYYKLNNEIFPPCYTQNLYKTEIKERYKDKTRDFFNVIQNDETKYNDFVNKFIHKLY